MKCGQAIMTEICNSCPNVNKRDICPHPGASCSTWQTVMAIRPKELGELLNNRNITTGGNAE